jgi:hypothetical protein
MAELSLGARKPADMAVSEDWPSMPALSPETNRNTHTGELFPEVGFIVTNLETDNRAVVRFYNKRGTVEQ